MKIALMDTENIAKLDLLSHSSFDKIIIFTSKNSPRVNFKCRAGITLPKISYVSCIGVCKNNMDHHIMTYSGYLFGRYDNADISIISNDHDFDNIITYWQVQGKSIRRIKNVVTKKPAAVHASFSDLLVILSAYFSFKENESINLATLNSLIHSKHPNKKISLPLLIEKSGINLTNKDTILKLDQTNPCIVYTEMAPDQKSGPSNKEIKKTLRRHCQTHKVTQISLSEFGNVLVAYHGKKTQKLAKKLNSLNIHIDKNNTIHFPAFNSKQHSN